MNLAIVILASCATFQPDVADRAKAAIEKVRGQKSYRTRFSAEIRVPNSDPMILKGEGLWIAGGVVFIHYGASAGEDRCIVRVGDRVWVYHVIHDVWATAEELGMNGAGRGIQNPDEVLAVLGRHLTNAAAAGKQRVGDRECDVVQVKVTGDDIEKIMKEQAQQGSFDWKQSAADPKLLVGPDGLIWRMPVSAELVSTDPNIKGQKVRYTADVQVVDYNAAFMMAFSVEDPKAKVRIDVPIDPAILAAIDKRSGAPQELLAEVAKAREARIAKLVADLAAADKVEACEFELVRFGQAAVPALKKALDDKQRAAAAKKILDQIEK